MKKAKLPGRYEILSYWKEWLYKNDRLIDIGEPVCWACQIPIDFNENKDLEGKWESVGGKLERHHIVPESLGGSSTVDNLFLLCPRCHDNVPMVANKEIFLQWVKGQNWAERKFDEVLTAIGAFISTNTERDEFIEWLSQKRTHEIDRILRQHQVGLHFGDYGSKIPKSSGIGLLVAVFREQRGSD